MVEPLIRATLLALVNERLVEGLVVPLFEKYQWDRFWLLYLSWVTGAALVFLTGANLFAGYIQPPFPANPELIGVILTAVVAGGGSNLLDKLFKRAGMKSS